MSSTTLAEAISATDLPEDPFADESSAVTRSNTPTAGRTFTNPADDFDGILMGLIPIETDAQRLHATIVLDLVRSAWDLNQESTFKAVFKRAKERGSPLSNAELAQIFTIPAEYVPADPSPGDLAAAREIATARAALAKAKATAADEAAETERRRVLRNRVAELRQDIEDVRATEQDLVSAIADRKQWIADNIYSRAGIFFVKTCSVRGREAYGNLLATERALADLPDHIKRLETELAELEAQLA